MNSPDSLRLDDELARLLKAYDQGIGDADGDAPTLNVQELPPELLKMLEQDAGIGVTEPAVEEPDIVYEHVTASPSHRVGRFELRRLLGKGGFGIVFLAFDPKLRREVALKIPRPEMLLSADARRRLAREALAAAGFDHPNLVPVYETGEIGPVCFIATGYCPGETLAQWLDRQAYPVPLRQAARLVAILAEAVQHAHYRGVLHRDLKPTNVILQVIKHDPAEQEPALGSCVLRGERFLPRVVDFGLAKVTERSTVETGTRQIVGTPRYMAPEQAQARQEDIGPTADVYALGVILYELLTGRAPYDGATDVEVLRQSIEGKFTPPRVLRPKVPRDLEAICLKAMARHRANRYPTALDLADDLRRFLTGLPTLARPLGKRARALKWLRRNDQMVALGIVTSLALFFLTVGTWSGYQHRRLKDDRDVVLRQQESSRQQDRDRMYAQSLRNAFHYWRAGDAVPMGESLGDARRLALGALEMPCFAHDFLARMGTWPTRVIASPHGPALCLAMTTSGDRWATGHADGTLALWDAVRGKVLSSTKVADSAVKQIVFASEGRQILVVPVNETPKFWKVDAEGGLQEGSGLGIKDRVTSVAASPDQKLLVVGTSNGQCLRCPGDPAAASPSPFLSVSGEIDTLTLAPDGRTLAIHTRNGDVTLWDAVTGEPLPRAAPVGKTEKLLGFGKHSAGNWNLVYIPVHESVIRSRARDGSSDVVLASPASPVRLMQTSPDGELLLTSGSDSIACVWDRNSGTLRNLLQGHSDKLLAAEFTPGTRSLLTTSSDGTLATWDLRENPSGPIVRERPSRVVAVAPLPDRDACLIAYADGSVECSDREQRLCEPGSPVLTALRATANHSIIGLEFSPNHVIARTLGPAGAKCLEKTPESPSNFTTFALSDDGLRLAVGSDRGQVTVWSLESGLELSTASAEGSAIRDVTFAPDGEWIAIREILNDKFTKMSLQGFGPQFMLGVSAAEGPPLLRYLTALDRVAVAGRGSAIRICELDGRTRAILIGHTGAITSLASSPDGRILVSGSSTGEVKFWDPRTGLELFGMPKHSGPVTQIAFSADGRRVITAGASRQGRGEYAIWDAGPRR